MGHPWIKWHFSDVTQHKLVGLSHYNMDSGKWHMGILSLHSIINPSKQSALVSCLWNGTHLPL